MESAEVKLTKSCLLVALRCYSTAIRNMEQTIMLPSSLRDVLSEEPDDNGAAQGDGKDLYEYYLMLKSIRNIMESGLLPLDDRKGKSQPPFSGHLEPLQDTDPETLCHYHLRGLFSVLGHLTKKSQTLTRRYKEILGLSN
ncbi:thyroid hormone-inducible hepatic protein [Amia ocellicauda]|uniref:thyroid hormone-inducible hepatic protein n=1 Tax=Amia ocellicauda TaxID=2972642 RepID=UPI003464BD3D|nr:M1I1B protein [Amia calva]